MSKIKVFISSVQSEFVRERQMLFSYLMADALLGLFFEPFIFENLPASEQSATRTYLGQAAKCDIYIGLFGTKYGHEDENGISPTEHEFNQATRSNKTRLIFLSNCANTDRHPKELALIQRAEQEVVRKKFANITELKTAIYSSLVRYLEEKEYIRTGPFDAAICGAANLSDIDDDKVVRFATIAKAKRGFPLHPESPINDILIHLNLLNNNKISGLVLTSTTLTINNIDHTITICLFNELLPTFL